ncbi:MAG: hypothetical protein HLUCCA13_15735 [Halomonas sp. HL-48]|nr:hypothetical protein [Halomonas sp. HL-48]KPQ22925.1 MAG: hypothetical protein HLUCCA13_15735 [Halomonas sp. HL-48]
MSNREQFPTIWDAPKKPSTRKAASPAHTLTKAAKPVKEAFLSIWDTPTRTPAA